MVVVWEVLAELRQLMLPIHRRQEHLQQRCDTLLVIDAMHHFNGRFERSYRFLSIPARVLVRVVNLTELLQDEASLSLHVHDVSFIIISSFLQAKAVTRLLLDLLVDRLIDDLVNTDGLVVQTLSLKHVAEFLE